MVSSHSFPSHVRVPRSIEVTHCESYSIPQANRPAKSPVPAIGVNIVPAPVLDEGVAALLEFVVDCSRLPTGWAPTPVPLTH